MIDIFIKIIPGIIIAIFTSYITAYLTAKWSLKRFYSEKWWERKEKAYGEIMDALYDLLKYCEIQKEDYGGGTGYSDEKMKELGERYNQAFWKIKKTADIGAFVVSLEAEKILIELHNRPRLEWNENPPWDIYDQDYKYYREALTRIVDVAKRDLKASRA
jgi:hypothetical protein